MKYIKIRAKNYNDAMMKLKMEHGDDAIPISHKYVKEGGLFKSALFAKEVVELTAAVQEKNYPKKKSIPGTKMDYIIGKDDKTSKNINGTNSMNESANVTRTQKTINSINKNIDALNDNLNNFKTPVQTIKHEESKQQVQNYQSRSLDTPVAHKSHQEVQTKINTFEKEFNDIKEALNKIMGGQKQEQTISISNENIDPCFSEYYTVLKNNDFDLEDCNKIISDVKNLISNDDLKDKYKIEKNLKELLKSRIVTTGPINAHKKKKIMMFIGPTGVGKTTTMAKLGAIYSLRENKKVVFITIDNYRIAATEQLKKYAEIMRIPVFAVNNHAEFKDVVAKESADIIMIDTSGRSHKNNLKLTEIKNFSDMIEMDFEKVLCVSATTKKQDLGDVFESFGLINYDNVIITKVDETSYIGNVVDIADKYNKPISYFTNGQEVPNDIVVADADNIVDMMIGTLDS